MPTLTVINDPRNRNKFSWFASGGSEVELSISILDVPRSLYFYWRANPGKPKLYYPGLPLQGYLDLSRSLIGARIKNGHSNKFKYQFPVLFEFRLKGTDMKSTFKGTISAVNDSYRDPRFKP